MTDLGKFSHQVRPSFDEELGGQRAIDQSPLFRNTALDNYAQAGQPNFILILGLWTLPDPPTTGR